MNKIGDVKKILDKYFPYTGKSDKRNKACYEICQLFEPKPIKKEHFGRRGHGCGTPY